MNKFINRYSIKENIHAVDGDVTVIPLQTAQEEEVNFLKISDEGVKFESSPIGQFTVVGEEFDGTIFFTRTPQEALIINQVTGKTAIVYYLEKNIKPVLDEIYNSGCPNNSILLVDRSKSETLGTIKTICSSFSLVSVHCHESFENLAELSVERGFDSIRTALTDIENGSEAKKSGPQINFTRVTDLGDIKGTDWIIDELIQSEGFSNIFGPSGEHKSFVALDMACCIATGKDFHGRETKKTAVIYVCGEGEDGINARIKAWQAENGHEGPIDVYMTSDPVRLLNEGYKDALVDSVKALEEAEGIKVEACIVDTMNRAFGDGDENNTRDMTMFTDACIDLRRETKMSVILVHHTSTSNPRQARGNGSLKASLETEINVLNPRNDNGEKLGYVELNVTKQKNGAEIEPMFFMPKVVGVGQDLKGREVTSLVMQSGPLINHKVEEIMSASNTDSKKPKRAQKVKENLNKKLETTVNTGYNSGMSPAQKAIFEIIESAGGKVPKSALVSQVGKMGDIKLQAKQAMESMLRSNVITMSGDEISLVK